MPLSSLRALSLLILASMPLALGAPRPALAESGPRLWAYCFFEASGGVGTKIAMIVTEPFEIDASRKDKLNDIYIAKEYDKTEGISNLLPGYVYFMSISGTDCRVRNTREEAQAGVEVRRTDSDYGISRVVPWKPSAEHTGLGGGRPSVKEKSGAAPPLAAKPPTTPAPADLAELSRQARERVAKLANDPEIAARSKQLAQRRSDARSGRTPGKPASTKAATAAKPKPDTGATLYWSCHYWDQASKTSYYSAISSAPQDKSISIVQEGLNYRNGWVIHLTQRGLSPGKGGNCQGMHLEKDIITSMSGSKAFWVGNHQARIVDTGWLPAVAK